MKTQELEKACREKLAALGEENNSPVLNPEEASFLEIETWDDESQIGEGGFDD